MVNPVQRRTRLEKYLEFAHAVVDHHLDLRSFLVDHGHHDDACQKSHNANGRGRNTGDISGGGHLRIGGDFASTLLFETTLTR